MEEEDIMVMYRITNVIQALDIKLAIFKGAEIGKCWERNFYQKKQ